VGIRDEHCKLERVQRNRQRHHAGCVASRLGGEMKRIYTALAVLMLAVAAHATTRYVAQTAGVLWFRPR